MVISGDGFSKGYSLAEILERLKQVLPDAELLGEESMIVDGLASLSKASATHLTFLSHDKYLSSLKACRAAAILLKPEHASSFSGNRFVVSDPYLAFAVVSELFVRRTKHKAGIHVSASISPSALIADSASIGQNVVIGDHVRIGEHCEIHSNVCIGERSLIGNSCILYSNVSVYHDVKIGSHVTIHSSAVIGADGFGFAPDKNIGWRKIYQLGGVTIGDRVEVGASTTIDRGAIDDTVIADGVIIDNQVQIGHNCHVGENSAIAGCSGIAGSTTIGRGCTVAGGVGINGHISIADNSHFLGGSVVTKGTRKGGVYASGAPMMEVKPWKRSTVRVSQLDELFERVKSLEKIFDNQ